MSVFLCLFLYVSFYISVTDLTTNNLSSPGPSFMCENGIANVSKSRTLWCYKLSVNAL